MAVASTAAFRKEMEEAWSRVHDLRGPVRLLGDEGSKFVKSHVIATSTHEFTVAMTLLASMAPLTNGATINLFGNDETPLNSIAFNIGYPQTRKSQMTRLITVQPENNSELIPRARKIEFESCK